MTGHRLRFARARRRAQEAARSNRFDTFLPAFRLFASCDRIENDNGITHTKQQEKALIFSSNWGCVTSPGAKVATNCVDCLWSRDCARRDRLNRRELVCAIASHTSEDSAGTESTAWYRVANSQHQRDPVGGTRTEWHYDCAAVRCKLDSFSLALFSSASDQGSFARQPKRSLAAKCGGKMEVAVVARGRSSRHSGRRSSEYFRITNGKRTHQTGCISFSGIARNTVATTSEACDCRTPQSANQHDRGSRGSAGQYQWRQFHFSRSVRRSSRDFCRRRFSFQYSQRPGPSRQCQGRKNFVAGSLFS